jgi:tetratricopeptide (TPR) repeat protein
MTEVNTSTKIPDDLIEEVRKLEYEGYVHLRMGRYKDAVDTYNKIYRMLLDRQFKEERRIHKGAPLHMMGMSFLSGNKLQNSLYYFFLAYVEDTLNVPPNDEDLADETPAGRTLREIFRVNPEILQTIKNAAFETKRRGETIFDPENLLHKLQIGKKGILKLASLRPKPIRRQSINQIPDIWEKRVFIDGNYNNLVVLKEIKEIVIRFGYTPILALDFDVPEQLIHHHDLMLLHNCKYAIFEVSQGNGHLMEIERAKDYDVCTLLVFSARDEQRRPSSDMSSMLRTIGPELNGYMSLDELRSIIRDFLS